MKKIAVRVTGAPLNERSFGDAILAKAVVLGMVSWRIAPDSVTLYPDSAATVVDLLATVNAMARKVGGRAKVSPDPRFHFEIVSGAAATRRAA